MVRWAGEGLIRHLKEKEMKGLGEQTLETTLISYPRTSFAPRKQLAKASES